MGKQVRTPRFYCDVPTFLHAVGYPEYFTGSSGQAELMYMNPSNQFTTTLEATWGGSYEVVDTGEIVWYDHYKELHRIGRNTYGRTAYPINFCALLNHNYGYLTSPNMADGWINFAAKRYYEPWNQEGYTQQLTGMKNILNSGVGLGDSGGSTTIKPDWNGTSIFSFEEEFGVWSSFSTLIQSDTPAFLGGFLDDRLSPFYTGNEKGAGIGLGSMVVGKYWDAPNSPDMSLTMSRRFDGIKKQKTIGGKTLANIYYDGPTEWSQNRLEGYFIEGDENDESQDYSAQIKKYPPFELDSALPSGRTLNFEDTDYAQYVEMGKEYYKYRAKSGLGRKGLKSWKLTFSYISEDDMWMAYEHSSVAPFAATETFNTDTESDVPKDGDRYVSSFDNGSPEESHTNPMLSDNSFNYVWNVTLGGTLPFIFQPDKTNNNPDQFSICTFRGDTLSVTQQAHNVYKLSVTIDEVA